MCGWEGYLLFDPAKSDLSTAIAPPNHDMLVTVLDALPVPAFFLEMEEIRCNRAAEKLTGYHRDEISTVSAFFTRLCGKAAEKARTAFEADRKAGFIASRDFSVTCKDGTAIILELTGLDSGRQFCTMLDVTDSRRMERELLSVSKKLSSFTDASLDTFLLADLSGQIIEASDRCEQIYGYSKKDLLSMSLSDLETKETKAEATIHLQSALRRGRHRFISCHLLRDGSTMDIDASVMYLSDDRQFLVFIRDISNYRCPEREALQKTQKALIESEERYRALSTLTSDYVHCCSRSGELPYRVQWLGGAVEEITGFSEAEIFAKGCWLESVHPDDRKQLASHLMELRPGQSYSGEFRVVCKDGSICWIEESCRCEAGSGEGELRLYGACKNITAHKNAEITLRNVDKIFNLFLEHSPAYLIFKDKNHKILKLSKNFERLHGMTASEMVGKTYADFHPPEVAKRMMQDDLLVLSNGKPVQLEDELHGRIYSSLKFAIPQRGKSPLLVSIRTDITEHKEAENALCRLNEKLDRLVAERTAQLEAAILEQESFSYSVSHDLRAPLRHINSYSAMLLESYLEILPDEARDYLKRICKSTKRMGVLIDNLLELSRVSRTTIQRNQVNLSEMAEGIARVLEEMEPDRKVDFAIEPGLHANCDLVLVQQLFENLLGNAWKYTAKVPEARIEFSMVRSGKDAVFFIKDNGAGFDMIYRDKLFIPFQRLHGAEFEGNGIGLATAQRIVMHHGGSIWAEGEAGAGAQFYFTLP